MQKEMITMKNILLPVLVIIFLAGLLVLPVSGLNSSNLSIPNGSVIVMPPDLGIGQIRAPENATMGFPLDGTFLVLNTGPSDARNVTINFYLLPKNSTESSPIWFHQKTSEIIPRLYREMVPFSAKVPTGISPGFYDLMVTISSTNREANLKNNQNITSSPVYISPGRFIDDSHLPDLLMSIDSISSNSTMPGYPLSINYTMYNTGTQSSGQYYIGFYLSPDQEITPSDYELWDQIYYKSYPGMKERGYTTNIVPESIPPGEYYLGAIIDVASSVPESNRSNNQALYADPVRVIPPKTIDKKKFLDEIAGYVAIKTNLYRNYRGLSNLTFDPSLSNIAKLHSEDMAKRKYFSHYTPEGLDPTARAEGAGYETTKQLPDGSGRTGVAENIVKIAEGYAVGKGYSGFVDPTDPQAVADIMLIEWINSPEHNDNLIDPTISRIGVGIASDGEFFYGTQNFF